MAPRFFAVYISAFALVGMQPAIAATTTVVVDEQAAAVAGGNTEQRLRRIERLLDNQVMLEMLQKVENLQQEIRELRGEIESQGFELQSMRKRQRDLYLDSDRRLRDLELGTGGGNASASSDISDNGSNVGVSTATPSATVDSSDTGSTEGNTSSTASSTASADPVQEKAAYTQAFNYLKEGRYEKAIKAFSKFLLDYPTGNYADNAQYWLGESNYVSKFYDNQRTFIAFAWRYFCGKKLILCFDPKTKIYPIQRFKMAFDSCIMPRFLRAVSSVGRASDF